MLLGWVLKTHQEVLTGPCSIKSEYASAVAVSREWWMLTWRANSIFSHETTNRKKEQWGNKENPWAPTLRRAVSNPTLFLVVLYVSVVLVFGTWRKQPLLLFLLLRVILIGERTSCGKAHLLSQESCSPSLPMVFCRFISPNFSFLSFFLDPQDLLFLLQTNPSYMFCVCVSFFIFFVIFPCWHRLVVVLIRKP